MAHKPIIIGCDNAAVELKHVITSLLDEEGIPYEDVGVNNSEDPTAYPSIAALVAQRIIDRTIQRKAS